MRISLSNSCHFPRLGSRKSLGGISHQPGAFGLTDRQLTTNGVQLHCMNRQVHRLCHDLLRRQLLLRWEARA